MNPELGFYLGVSFHQWEGWSGLIFSVFGQGTRRDAYSSVYDLDVISPKVILQFRLYALYSADKKKTVIVTSMIAGFVVCTALCTWLMWINILEAQGEETSIVNWVIPC